MEILESLDLPYRTFWILKRNGVDTVDEFKELTIDNLTLMKGMGRKQIDMIVKMIEEGL